MNIWLFNLLSWKIQKCRSHFVNCHFKLQLKWQFYHFRTITKYRNVWWSVSLLAFYIAHWVCCFFFFFFLTLDVLCAIRMHKNAQIQQAITKCCVHSVTAMLVKKWLNGTIYINVVFFVHFSIRYLSFC